MFSSIRVRSDFASQLIFHFLLSLRAFSHRPWRYELELASCFSMWGFWHENVPEFWQTFSIGTFIYICPLSQNLILKLKTKTFQSNYSSSLNLRLWEICNLHFYHCNICRANRDIRTFTVFWGRCCIDRLFMTITCMVTNYHDKKL